MKSRGTVETVESWHVGGEGFMVQHGMYACMYEGRVAYGVHVCISNVK